MTNELIDKTASNFNVDEFDKKGEEPTSTLFMGASDVVAGCSNNKSSTTMPSLNSDTNEFPSLKNKTGNGLKSKNSNRRPGIHQDWPDMVHMAPDIISPKRLRLDVPNNEVLESAAFIAKQLEDESKVFVSPNMPLNTNISALSSCNSSASSSSSSSPIQFSVQMQLEQLAANSASSVESLEKSVPPVVDLATPEVITVEETPSPISQPKDAPVVVDLCQADNTEIHALYKQFCEMFPSTPKLYLEQQAADLVGKHAAINRFIDELFENDSKPPEYWKPDVLTIPLSPNSSNLTSDGFNQPGSLNLSSLPDSSHVEPEKEKDHKTAVALGNQLLQEMGNFSQVLQDVPIQHQPSSSSSKETDLKKFDITSISNDLQNYDEPIPGPSGTQNRSIHTENQLPNNSVIRPDSTSNHAEVTEESEEEKREQQMDKRVQNLLSLFPQKDPEYLRTKNNEFGLDAAGATAFEAWVLEVVENGGKDLPSREDYDKRKKVRNHRCYFDVVLFPVLTFWSR